MPLRRLWARQEDVVQPSSQADVIKREIGSSNDGLDAGRNSRRALLVKWLGRTVQIGKRAPSKADAQAAAEAPTTGSGKKTSSPATSSPRSPNLPTPPDLLKPLPSPPIDGTSNRPKLLRLDRIMTMSSLSAPDIEKLFSGAPQFFSRSEGHGTGAPHPSVAFPWDEGLDIRDLTDHAQIEDEAWRCATAWPTVTRDPNRKSIDLAERSPMVKKRPHFYPRTRERPNMLSMQGLEKGTVGYQAALELAVADALQEEQWGFNSLGGNAQPITDQRKALLTSKEGLRPLDETAILEHLSKSSTRYSEKHARDRKSVTQLHSELFREILYPPSRVLNPSDPYGISAQIQALLKVLAAPNVWVDFSHVEWRIRLGQILWGSPAQDDVDDGSSIRASDSATDLLEERYWLLLHILIACELLIRLDIITEEDELGGANVTQSDMHKFDKEASQPVKWALHVARIWLENIELVKKEDGVEQTAKLGKRATWLATLSRTLSVSTPRDESGKSHQGHFHHRGRSDQYVMRGKHVERQIDGLLHFAEALKWPDMDVGPTSISANCRAVTEGTPISTPIATPGTSDGRRGSYFENVRKEVPLDRTISRRKKVTAAFRRSGWLTKSYISGFMLPGEGISHFLMSSLLENDPQALKRLGAMANLCGGFVYSGKSFWSTASVVGRVLAAGRGAAVCMGWVSSDVVPEGVKDGWINVETEDIAEDMQHINKKARLWSKTAIEKESHVLGDGEAASVLPGDFIIPKENPHRKAAPMNFRIAFKLLELLGSSGASTAEQGGSDTAPSFTPLSDSSMAPSLLSYPAGVTFAVTEGEKTSEISLTLAKDAYFATAHPCVASQHVRIFQAPASPTIREIDTSGQTAGAKAANPVHSTGHPLHKVYTYAALHLSELLAKREASLDELLVEFAAPFFVPTTTQPHPKFLVVDCITGFTPLPQDQDIPRSPLIERPRASQLPAGSVSVSALSLTGGSGTGSVPRSSGVVAEPATKKMHWETRRRQFGSDMEIFVRAICAQKGWNALISRRRRGCLACAIREAGALGWRVVIRVD